MYKAILVEDEAVVREGIVGKLDWNARGFELMAACEDGLAALAALEAAPVDLVITDISMPNMDGLALAGEVRRRWPDTVVVILTGYADFSYAQQAIHHQVQDYMLKPVTAKQLSEQLDKLRALLDERTALRQGEAPAHALLTARFLERLLDGALEDGEFSLAVREHALPVGVGPWRLVTALPATDAAEADLLQALEDTDGVLPLPRKDGLAPMLCTAGGARAVCAAAAGLPGGASLAVSDEAADTDALNRAAEQAAQLAARLFCLPAGTVAGTALLADARPHLQSQAVDRRGIVAAVKTLEARRAKTQTAALLDALRTAGLTRAEALARLEKLMIQLGEHSEEEGLLPAGALEEALERLRAARHLIAAGEVADAWLDSVLEAGRQRSNGASRQAKAAVEFIKRYYGQPALSLQDVTGHLSVSTSHFSAVFKSATGFTFLEFLTRVRIERARELLATTDLRNYEVAERVGYEDPGYFGTIFKKITGFSPADYRKTRR